MNDRNEDAVRSLVRSAVVRMRVRIIALVFSLASGVVMWVATAWLLVRGGYNVGEHLSLLALYFPGYSVSWTGAFVGFFWGALAGGGVGFALASVYNFFVDRADKSSS